MRAITAPKDMRAICQGLNKNSQTIGLVPTMGALHDGHMELIRRSLKENDTTVVSIFVNPLQFNKEEDLKNYPRTFERDSEKLKSLNVDFLFCPSTDEFYPEKPSVSLSFGRMEEVLEGQFRPGHFRGVGVAVSKLLHVVNPDRAYFGLKDLQQFLLIRKMTRDLNFATEVIGVETVREDSGLAMSSRNQRLSSEGLKVAASIYEGLSRVKSSILQKKKIDTVKAEVLAFYSSIGELEVEYLEIADGITLEQAQDYEKISELAVCFAGYVEGVRLIDNLYLRLN